MAEDTRLEIDIELFGGPEDGRTIKVPAQRDGVPTLPRWEFPQLPKERNREKLKAALAERPAEPSNGRWKYVYAGTRARS